MNYAISEHWTENDAELWNIKKEKLKSKYPFLRDEDLKYSEGSEKMMLMLLCYKLHITMEMLTNMLASL